MGPTVIATFGTIAGAELARSALVAAGIEAEIADEEMVGINWLYSNALGGVKLVVPGEDAERALEILTNAASADDSLPEMPESLAAPPAQPDVCAECGSSESTRLNRLLVFAMLALLMYGIGVAVDQRELAVAGIAAAALIAFVLPPRRCARCGARWPEMSDEPPKPEAPPPDGRDLIEELCPRCGSPEYYAIDHRSLKAIPMLFSPSVVALLAIWPFLPKKQCDACGYRR